MLEGWTVSAVVALMGLVWAMLRGITELQRQNAVKRFEIFQAMDKRFDERDFADLRRLLDETWLLHEKISLLEKILENSLPAEELKSLLAEKLKLLPAEKLKLLLAEKLKVLLDEKWLLDGKFSSYDVETKLNFAAFFEELAVSVNSKVMSKEVAFYSAIMRLPARTRSHFGRARA